MDMSCSLIAGLVLLLSATSVVGTGGEWLRHWYLHRERHTRCWWRYYVATTADANSTECVSQQELAAVKAEIASKVDKLHSQINYWQGVTVNNIFQDNCKTGYTATTWLGLATEHLFFKLIRVVTPESTISLTWCIKNKSCLWYYIRPLCFIITHIMC